MIDRQFALKNLFFFGLPPFLIYPICFRGDLEMDCFLDAWLLKTTRQKHVKHSFLTYQSNFNIPLSYEVDYLKYSRFEVPLYTLYNTILHIARNFLETRENIKILTHSFYHINLGWFSWEWSKKKIIFFRKKNSKWPTQKKLIFQNRQFSKIFRENFSDGSLG